MTRLRSILACALLAAASALLIAGTLAVLDARALIKAQFGVAQSEAEKTRALLERQANQTRQDVLYRADAALAIVRTLPGILDARAAAIQADARDQVSGAVQLADQRAAEATGAIVELRADIGATLEETRRLQAASTRAVELLTPQALGLVAAAKVAAGETAQAARRVDAALPKALLTWQEIGTNVVAATNESARTAQASRVFMGNLAEQTKPLPTWLRIGLAVAPPVVQTGFTTASWLAIRR